MADEPNNLPTVREWLQQWLGFQLPTIPMPQTLKNLDRAISSIVLATANNAKIRIDGSTNKIKAANKIAVDDMFDSAGERRKFSNRAAATKAAIDDLNERPPDIDAKSDLEEDWLNTFGRLAEEKSSEELQSLFGKILAGEIRKPGSFSLRTLQFVANLSRSDAEGITRLFPFVINQLIVPFVNDTFAPLAIGVRISMEELGILSGSSNRNAGMALDIKIEPHADYVLLGTQLGLKITNNSAAPISGQLAGQPITSVARELFPIARHGITEADFLRDVALHLGTIYAGRTENGRRISNSCGVDLIKVTQWLPDDAFTFTIIENLVSFEQKA